MTEQPTQLKDGAFLLKHAEKKKFVYDPDFYFICWPSGAGERNWITDFPWGQKLKYRWPQCECMSCAHHLPNILFSPDDRSCQLAKCHQNLLSISPPYRSPPKLTLPFAVYLFRDGGGGLLDLHRLCFLPLLVLSLSASVRKPKYKRSNIYLLILRWHHDMIK